MVHLLDMEIRSFLVGINYDADGKDKKHHTCIIEEYENGTLH